MNTHANGAFRPHSRLSGQSAEFLQDYYAGRKVWGDDFQLDEIREWYQMEENACFEIYSKRGQVERGKMPNNDYMHWQYGFKPALAGRGTFGKTLGLGSGNGEEFRPVRKYIEHLYIVESAEGYFQNDATTTYVKAQVDGTLQFEDNFFDTAVNIAVLHHIPNLSHVVRELYRVLKPGGVCLVKEPIISLGRWDIPRTKGLAPCERGFPRELLQTIVQQTGFEIVRRTYFEFQPLRLLRDRGLDTYNSAFWTKLDRLFSFLTDWNYRYHRTSFFQRFAPSYIFLVLRKRDTERETSKE
jgi:SAM-dependent methyltransferase